MTKAIESQRDTIEKIINSLIKVYNPRSIYIFGSYAWGTPDGDSDLDFAVIVDESDLDMASRIRLSSNELWDIGIPTDILVYTKDEIERKSSHSSTLQHRILKEGTKIYEAT
ncbi:MAG: nucleotidyltransferase domain-containing protein [Spirochaetes bacterium]|nr:MAG: nucleotidyltransferase domain-containing protein [Spirochaetota bacterium]RKX95834.1 MAG: nucleotidyltransferase domain-containing protein [Spirochaetota bacterium]